MLRSAKTIDGQEVADDRLFRPGVIGKHLALQIGVGIRHPLVLAKMLGPGFNHEPLDDLFGVGRILGDAPPVGTIAAALPGKMIDRVQEGCAVLLLNLVLDQD